MQIDQLKKIMLVEDEEDIRSVAKISLENIGGFEVKYCSTGEEALQEVKQFYPDLILMDVMMPGMDGVSTFNELKKDASFQQIPVIFMTAKVQSGEIANYLNMGALDVITKPFDPLMLPEQIKKIWLDRNE